MDYQESVSLETCLRALISNKTHYVNKGLDMQIYFVAQLFHTSYKKIVNSMKEIEKGTLNSVVPNN